VDPEDPFAFRCLVRRVGDAEEDGSIRYGCQFESIAPREQDRLLSAIFTLQREEIRRQKEREELI
jgi:c-di-GMP-binding flagellar brake protein YcgR